MSDNPAREFLSRATPVPPEALRTRMRAAVEGLPDARDVPAALLDAGIGIAEQLGAGASRDRRAALDLLAADALVTYAFEAASADPSRVPALADDAMRRIASLAEAE